MLLFEFNVVVAQADVVGLEVNIFISVANAIHLIAEEFAQLSHVTRIGTQVEQVERRTRRALDNNLMIVYLSPQLASSLAHSTAISASHADPQR